VFTDAKRPAFSWQVIAELIGAASIVASLVFVGLQLKQSEATARAELWQAIGASGIEYQQTFIDNADVWARGNSGGLLSAPEKEVFNRLVVLADDQALSNFNSARQLGLLEGRESTVVSSFAIWLTRYPCAKQVWRKREAELQRNRRRLNPDLPTVHPWVSLVEETVAALDSVEDQTAHDGC
jgi:hypothetical protein